MLEVGNKAPGDRAQLLIYIEGLRLAIRNKVLIKCQQLLVRAEQLAKRADAALFYGGH